MAKNPSATNPRSTTKRTVKDQSGASKLKIGELLSKAGYITSAQFDEAKTFQRRFGLRISRILLEEGTIESDTVPNFLSRMHGFIHINLNETHPTAEALAKLPYNIAKEYLDNLRVYSNLPKSEDVYESLNNGAPDIPNDIPNTVTVDTIINGKHVKILQESSTQVK